MSNFIPCTFATFMVSENEKVCERFVTSSYILLCLTLTTIEKCAFSKLQSLLLMWVQLGRRKEGDIVFNEA